MYLQCSYDISFISLIPILYSLPKRYLVILSFHVFPDSLCTIGNILFLKYSTVILKQQKQSWVTPGVLRILCVFRWDALEDFRCESAVSLTFLPALCSPLWRCELCLLSQDGWPFGFHVISDDIKRTFLNVSLGTFVGVLRMNSFTKNMFLFTKN